MSVAKKGARLGVAAFAVGLSLAGPQVAVAVADDADTAGPDANSTTQSEPSTARPARVARSAHHAAEPAPPVAAAAPEGRRVGAAQSRTPRAAATRPRAARSVTAPSAESSAPQAFSANPPSASAPQSTLTITIDPTVTQPGAPAASSPAPVPTPTKLIAAQMDRRQMAPAQPAPTAALGTLSVPVMHATASSITDIFTALFAPIQSFIDGFGLFVRRTFFNQAPKVTPIQTTGQVDGVITGTLNAVDPEGDPLTFRIVTAPTRGSVEVASDGTYIYRPGTDFTGIDSFNVAVSDGGFHINLFDLFRPSSTEAYVQVGQNATQAMLTFNFIYGSGSQFWSSQARTALQSAALTLASYFVVTTPTVITFDVTGESSSGSTLASAGSDLTGGAAGFFATVVQEKIISGVDSNGSAADGQIDWNFGRSWGYGTSVGNSYDFTSTAMHELLHTFGFLSNVDRAGSNTGQTWTTFDKYIVAKTNSGTVSVIDQNTFNWLTAYNTNLTGGNGGLYFAGPQALIVYGAPVPLYTPNPWQSGSSMSHLDDNTFTGSNDKLMNATTGTGLGVRVLSPVELAILKDLGYTVTDTPVFAVVFLGLLRRPRRKDARR